MEVLPFLNDDEMVYLLKIAKVSIVFYLDTSGVFPIHNAKLPKGSSFVTLYKNNDKKELRGCIGDFLYEKPLDIDVRDNALAAAFNDPRFPPLKKEELPNLELEVSVLSFPKKFEGTNDEFLIFLEKNKPGVILKKGLANATFLPDVWDQLKDPEEFLRHLSMKAGFMPFEWQNMEKYYYFTQSKSMKIDEIYIDDVLEDLDYEEG